VVPGREVSPLKKCRGQREKTLNKMMGAKGKMGKYQLYILRKNWG